MDNLGLKIAILDFKKAKELFGNIFFWKAETKFTSNFVFIHLLCH